MVISLVGTLIYGQVLDRFCDGFHVRKKVSILSKEHEKIQNYIVRELRRGATIYPAYGGLDHAEHLEVVTILEKNEYGKLLSFIHETDEHAFVTVSTVNEVVGAWNTVKNRIKIHSRITETSNEKREIGIFTGNVFLSMYYLRMADVHIISVYIRQGMFPSGGSHHLRHLPAEA